MCARGGPSAVTRAMRCRTLVVHRRAGGSRLLLASALLPRQLSPIALAALAPCPMARSNADPAPAESSSLPLPPRKRFTTPRAPAPNSSWTRRAPRPSTRCSIRSSSTHWRGRLVPMCGHLQVVCAYAQSVGPRWLAAGILCQCKSAVRVCWPCGLPLPVVASSDPAAGGRQCAHPQRAHALLPVAAARACIGHRTGVPAPSACVARSGSRQAPERVRQPRRDRVRGADYSGTSSRFHPGGSQHNDAIRPALRWRPPCPWCWAPWKAWLWCGDCGDALRTLARASEGTHNVRCAGAGTHRRSRVHRIRRNAANVPQRCHQLLQYARTHARQRRVIGT
jgi:hypothetical protein